MKPTTTKPAAKKAATKKAATKKVAPKKVAAKVSVKKNERTTEQEAEANMLANKKAPVTTTKVRKPAKAKAATKPASNSFELAMQVAQGMFEKKGENIKILDMRNVKGASTDFFVICHAASDKQVEAIANSVEEEVEKLSNEWPRHREGQQTNEWVLLDYFDVVAHIFQEEKREFYAVEELWGDAINIPFEGQ